MLPVDKEKDIMLAEDDSDEVLIFDTALQELRFPYTLRHAKDGDALFVLLKASIPYILFLDINMPCKDGMACIAEIRSNKEYDHLPVIMYTSHFAARIIEESFRKGANLYITKTATIQELVAKLKKIFAIDWADYVHYPPKNDFVL
ncbi:MAG: response regulator [Flavipsychrobacter sp.]|nr:response regulator [Flavipsychrobacter sp.]